MIDSVYRFLENKTMHPNQIVPDELSEVFLDHMVKALNGNIIDLPMLRTNLSTNGTIKEDVNIIVIDAGGTNYRCGLASLHNGKYTITNYKECKMPGAVSPVSWNEFISFLVDTIEPFSSMSDHIGFCFSYSASITDSCDGIVNTIDKEIKITGCEGQLIGESINIELKRRGLREKRVIILNDTVAALLGTYSSLDRSQYSGFSGMICGTGFNICTSYKGMIYNIESGYFTSINQGEIDKQLDSCSEFPGEKTLEKMISGVYIGSICKELLLSANKEGLISDRTANNISAVSSFNGAYVSALSCRNNIDNICDENDIEFVSEICDAMLERSARCASVAIIGVLKLNQNDVGKPACICSEGSLIAKSDRFKQHLFATLDEYAVKKHNLKYEIVIGKDTTLPGAATAALLNY